MGHAEHSGRRPSGDPGAPTAPPPTVDTPDGVIRGRILANGVRGFFGIPFAAPPIGAARFQPPGPVSPWSGMRDGTRYPPAPVQVGPFADRHHSEDCLYLNVWTPPEAVDAPVIAWVYPGGFEIGSASPPHTDGAQLAAHGVIVVSANVRLGALGFAHLTDLGITGWSHSTNLGLQDLVAALRWVRDRIGPFGGDASNVTLAGLSSGGFSIGALLAMPSARGLFDKAIMQSGATTRTFSAQIGTSMAEALVDRLGLSRPGDLMAVPAQRIAEVQGDIAERDIGRRNAPGGMAWGSVIDGSILPEEPQLAVRKGAAAHIPIIVGATTEEVRAFALLDPSGFTPAGEPELVEEIRKCVGDRADDLLAGYRSETPDAGLADLRSRFLTDRIYRIPAVRCATAQVDTGGAAWSYLFSWSQSNLGAHHAIDEAFVMDRLNPIAAADPEATAIRDEMLGAWLAFAKTGDPGWPVFDPGGGPTTRDFGGSRPLTSEPPGSTAAVWIDADRGGAS